MLGTRQRSALRAPQHALVTGTSRITVNGYCRLLIFWHRAQARCQIFVRRALFLSHGCEPSISVVARFGELTANGIKRFIPQDPALRKSQDYSDSATLIPHGLATSEARAEFTGVDKQVGVVSPGDSGFTRRLF
jgi:hypothetical protein